MVNTGWDVSERLVDNTLLTKMGPPTSTVAEPPWDTSVRNRLVHYSSEDHRAPLWIAALLALVYSFGILLIRTHIKWRVLSWDDYLILASTVSLEHE